MGGGAFGLVWRSHMHPRACALGPCQCIPGSVFRPRNLLKTGPGDEAKDLCTDLQTEFEVIWLLLPKVMTYGGFEPGRVLDVAILAWSKCKTPKCNLSCREMV